MLIIQGCNVREYSIHVWKKINTCTARRRLGAWDNVYTNLHAVGISIFSLPPMLLCQVWAVWVYTYEEKCIYMYASVSKWDCVSTYYGYMWTHLYNIKNHPHFTLYMSTCVKGIDQPCHGVSRQGSSSPFNLPLAYMSPTTHHQPRCIVVY